MDDKKLIDIAGNEIVDNDMVAVIYGDKCPRLLIGKVSCINFRKVTVEITVSYSNNSTRRFVSNQTKEDSNVYITDKLVLLKPKLSKDDTLDVFTQFIKNNLHRIDDFEEIIDNYYFDDNFMNFWNTQLESEYKNLFTRLQKINVTNGIDYCIITQSPYHLNILVDSGIDFVPEIIFYLDETCYKVRLSRYNEICSNENYHRYIVLFKRILDKAPKIITDPIETMKKLKSLIEDEEK